MDLKLRGKKAVVTGASRGIGRAIADLLAAEGADVAICARHADQVEAAVASFKAKGVNAFGATVDIADGPAFKDFIERSADALGGIDILVANAGGPPAGGFAGTQTDEYAKAFELNALSTVGMCEAAVPAMRAARWGRVLAITSATVRQPTPKLMLSTMARAGATGFLKSLALEVAVDGVTVNSIQPGSHDTERLRSLYGGDLSRAAADVPMGHVGDADDFGRVAAFLCSESARFITGAAIPVDGGRWDGLQ